MRIVFAIGAVLVLAVFGAALLAQEITGSVTGFVTDQSGSAVPEAALTFTNLRTGVSYRTVASHGGLYSMSLLPPGIYELVVQRMGFKTARISGIEIKIDSVVGKDVLLEVGELSQSVAVTAETNIVETERPSLGEVIQHKQLTELPLGQRNFLKLATTAAGVMPAPLQNGEAPYARRNDFQIAVSGQRHTSTNALFDGIPNKEFYIGAIAGTPPVDAVEEFKVQHGFFAGHYDNASVVNLVTRSGTNEFHGSAWDFHQNDNLNARNFFSVGKPESLQNVYGFAAGGPAIKNRLFGFGSYEGHRERVAGTGRGTVPQTSWLGGDFSSLGKQLNDPFTRQPFPNNIIPASRIDPFARKFIDQGFVPGETNPGTVFNLVKETGSVRNDNRYLARVDFAYSNADKFFVRYLRSDSLITSREATTPGSFFPLNSHNAVIDWVHVFNPTMTLNAKAGLNRVSFAASSRGLRAPNNQLWPSVFGLTNLNEVPVCDRPPLVSILGLSSMGGGGDCEEPLQNDYHYIVTMQKVTGRHQLSWGGEFRRKRQQLNIFNAQEGRFSYNNEFSGNGFADFLLGAPSQAQGSSTGAPVNKFGWWYNAFIHDDLKLSRSLSITMGVRYQVYPWLIEEQNKISVFNPAGRGSYIFASPEQRRLINVDKNDWAPRLGIAWAPGGRQDFVIRSSYGIFYDEVPGNELAWDSLGPNLTRNNNLVSDLLTPTIRMTGLFPSPLTSDPSQIRGISVIGLSDPNRRDPYQQVWTMSVQKTFLGLFSEAAYVGSHGVKLSKRRDINRPATANPPDCNAACRAARSPYPDWGFILTDNAEGQSYYHGLQLTLRKPLSHGLSFTSSYTYAKSLDWDSYDAKGARNYIPTDNDKGRSTFDVRQRFVTIFGYEVPSLLKTGFGRQIVGGWNLSGITSFQTGQPFSVTTSVDPANVGGVATRRPNRIGDGNLPKDQQRPERWFDTSAFQIPALGTYGNAGIHYLDTDGLISVDLSLAKNFPISESMRIQFRFEGFNFFNHVNFNSPNANLNSPAFAVVTSAQPARILQLGLKFIF